MLALASYGSWREIFTHCLRWAFSERPPSFPPQPPVLLRGCWSSQPGSVLLNEPLVPWRCYPWLQRRRPSQPFCSCFDFPLSHELSIHVTSASHHNHRPYSRALPRPYSTACCLRLLWSRWLVTVGDV